MGSVKKTAFEIIRRPRITEKTAMLGSVENSIVFDVHPKANKTEIKQAVEKIFNVKVKAVRTANFMGKQRRVGAKVGKKNDWKKAYVSLKEGNSIDIIEGL